MPTIPIPLDTIRNRHSRFERMIHRRNLRELVAGGVAALVLLVVGTLRLMQAQQPAALLSALGFWVLALGILGAVGHLFRRARKDRRDLALPGRTHLARRLGRERDALRRIWLTYVAPMLPGFVLIYLGQWLQAPESRGATLWAAGITAVVLLGVIVLNLLAARAIARELRELEREG